MIVFPGRADVSERQAERSGEEVREAGEDESLSREAEQHEASPGREWLNVGATFARDLGTEPLSTREAIWNK